VTIYFVRHAKAGHGATWSGPGPDSERPLSKPGRRQARELGTRLGEVGATMLVSSPSLRCVQTLEPLAERTGLPIGIDDRLDEGAPYEPVLELLAELAELADGAVLCSHGDVIPETIDALVRRGLDVRSPADWRKASVWVLERDKHGSFTRAVAWGPPGE
jgi:8-oxo-dGTP diphosphatase